MCLNRVYYSLKPIIPWQLRLALRRWRADRRRKTFANVWPIDPNSGNTPQGWPGWPDGKRFAFVLTHDVEGRKGLARVEHLMNLEVQHGFRSCFNFVPEGEYRFPDSVRSLLERSGFEVGVHGLEHDGKLYSSKAKFIADACRINDYAWQWNVSGFRSPLMQNRLGWLHRLDVAYDASTFDTDPFEPEPYGMGTIFPFWVAGTNGGGYVELPYTLVQDFTLFKVLREPSIEVWKSKIDWIAEHGGMALLNTHPDYMCFEGKQARDEYPVSHYEALLRYVREKYEGSYWAAQPREVARYYRDKVPVGSRNTRKKICMLAYTLYESDNRVRRYAEALARRGDLVDVIALEKSDCQEHEKKINGVTVYRIQKRDFKERTKWTYASRLLRFLGRSAVSLTRFHARNRYDVIHIHNMPDFLVFAAWYPRLTGAKLILDIHDVVPELFANKFSSRLNTAYIWFLKTIEKASARFVDHVIVSNHLWRDLLTGRSIEQENCSVFINSVDPGMFSPQPRMRKDGKYIVLFPGSFQWHQGLDIAIEAFSHFKRRVPNAEFHLYGGGNATAESELKELARQLGLAESVKFWPAVSLDRMAEVIANADLGVVPKRADSFGNEAYSTKIMEFMSQGVPVVVSRTKIDTFYFDEGLVHFFPSGDSEAMAQAMFDVVNDQELRESLIARGYEYVERYGWGQKKQQYLELIDSLSTERFHDIQLVPGPTSAVQRRLPGWKCYGSELRKFMVTGGPELLNAKETRSGNLRVLEAHPRTDPRWEAFVLGHPNGLIYHHPAWLEALEREYGQKGVYFICEDAVGQVLGILPMLYTRGLPLGVGKPPSGRRLSSLPRTPIAGPLSIDSEATVALLQAAVQRVSEDPRILLQIKTQGRELDGSIEGLVCEPWRLAYLLRLPAHSEGSYRINNSENRASVKRAINKAKRLGVYVRPAETEAELSTWYRLYLETMRRNLVPPRPYRFFASLWESLKPRAMMQLLLAEQESKGQRRIIAGSIFLMFGRTMSYGFNGSAGRDLYLRPNDLLHWEMINEACRSGFRLLDLGEVPDGNDDLARFNRKWGAEPVRLHRYYYPGSRDSAIVSAEYGGYPQLISGALWRRLPLAATAWLGDRIYAYL